MTGSPTGATDALLVVTTRSRLRGLRHFPRVLGASLRVRRQLAATDGLLCGASVIAGPTEFWTITVWRSQHLMQQFSREGAHGLVMWNYPRWLSSLWLMRWRPSGSETGSWGGMRLASRSEPTERCTASDAAPVPASMPELLAAIGADGAPSFESSAMARRGRQQVRGVRAALVRVRPPLRQVPRVLLGLRRLRRSLLHDHGLLRGVVGIALPSEVYFLGVWSDAADVERFLTHPWLDRAGARWPGGFWSISLAAQGEFGTWDGERLRRGPRAWRRVDGPSGSDAEPPA